MLFKSMCLSMFAHCHSGIMVYSGYEAYEEGKELGLYVKDVTGG
jgi:hypothetical protein